MEGKDKYSPLGVHLAILDHPPCSEALTLDVSLLQFYLLDRLGQFL